MKRLGTLVLVLVGIILTYGLVTFAQIYRYSRIDDARSVDAIVVLGAAQYSGSPSPVLRARLDHAADLYRKNLAPWIITTGGSRPGDITTEAAASKKYLIALGVPTDVILVDESSLTTKQNLSRVAELLSAKNLASILIVSDPFHMYRAGTLAHDLGIEAYGSPTQTSPIAKNSWLELKYMLREMVPSSLNLLFDA